MTETEPKRRWFRFSLRMLFVVVTIVGVVSGWYVNRLRIIKIEREKLAGMWQLELNLPPGPPVRDLEMDKQDVGVPSNGIGEIDFHMVQPERTSDGTMGNLSRAIYRFNGDTIEVAQGHPGEPRPTNFDPKTASVWKAKRILPGISKP